MIEGQVHKDNAVLKRLKTSDSALLLGLGAGLATDPVNSPPHYTAGKVEVIDFIEQVVTTYVPSIAYHIGNCLKYLARAPLKGKLLEDLKKARWYLDRAIQVLERKEEP